jgi:hypothetical protein
VRDVGVVDDHVLQVGDRAAITFQLAPRIRPARRPQRAPASLGALPVALVRDCPAAPLPLRRAGGALVPLRGRDAIWIGLSLPGGTASAIKVRVGSIDAVTGLPWRPGLHADPQDYVVCPQQRSLHGVIDHRGQARQLIASAVLRGRGMYLVSYAPKPGRVLEKPRRESRLAPVPLHVPLAGGSIEQRIVPDPYGLNAWSRQAAISVQVHFVTPAQFGRFTTRGTPALARPGGGYTGLRLP